MTTEYRRPLDAAALANNFRVFADAECAAEPLYAALSRAIAADPDTLDLLMQAPYAQRRPVLLFASVHDLLLEERPHALANFYRSVVGLKSWRSDVDAAPPLFLEFCRLHREALAALIASRSVQTNEVGRSAVLRLALSTLAADRPIALIDVGCSAGLNLQVDRYRFEYEKADGARVAVGPVSSVVVKSKIVSGDPGYANASPQIAQRFGIDRSPLDVHDDGDTRWLGACIWPSEWDRLGRLAAAIAMARRSPADIRRADALVGLEQVLAAVDRGVRPVVFHSWVVSYFDRETRLGFVDAVRRMIEERDGAWISAEGPNVVPGLDAPPLSDDAEPGLREATLWHLTTRESGVVSSRLLARSHPHGRWIHWLA